MSWSGQMYDVGIYKLNHLLLVHRDLHVGQKACFQIKPILFFGVVEKGSMHTGEIFTEQSLNTSPTEFKLENFPNGIVVTLNEGPGGGRYHFTAENMDVDWLLN
jgi:hypothetical protein